MSRMTVDFKSRAANDLERDEQFYRPDAITRAESRKPAPRDPASGGGGGDPLNAERSEQ
jgi:hypothetical protein